MTEQSLLPSADEASEADAVAQKPPRREPAPWLYGLGFLILAAAIFYIWQYPKVPAETAANTSALHNLDQRLDGLDQHVADIGSRLSQLEQRPAPDVGKINARLDALESRAADQAQLASRLDALSGRIESLSAREQTALDATKRQTDALTTRVAGLETSAGSLDTVTSRVNRLTQLQEASLALAAGKPLGDLPGSPPALARFAHAAPPTEAGLRLSFPQAEQAALAAGQPDAAQAPFVDRVWDRAQGLITIRRGNDIVIGNPAATILGHAQTALEAGDLASAVAAVETLTGQPAQAMADWLAGAKALLGARSALTEMAGQA